jgi:hypothetical protein
MEAQKAAADGDEVALAATHYCRAKLKEGTALSKELEASFREDKKRMSQDTGKTPTMYDLGYEHGMTAGREALFGEVSRMTEGGKSREAAMACHAAVRKETVASAVRGSSVELHEGKAGLGIYDQISAQQLLAERLDEQHQRFLRTTVDKAPVQAGVHSLSRKGLNIEGNAPWMSMTPKA